MKLNLKNRLRSTNCLSIKFRVRLKVQLITI